MLLSLTSARGAAGVPPEPHWGLLPLALVLLVPGVLDVLVALDDHVLAAAVLYDWRFPFQWSQDLLRWSYGGNGIHSGRVKTGPTTALSSHSSITKIPFDSLTGMISPVGHRT